MAEATAEDHLLHTGCLTVVIATEWRFKDGGTVWAGNDILSIQTNHAGDAIV